MSDITTRDHKPAQYGTGVEKDSIPIAAVAVRGGVVLALNISGYGKTASIVAGDIVVGVSDRAIDNSAGNAGDQKVDAQRDFWLDNDVTNAITQAHLFRSYCYLVDNHTVGSSDVGGTLAVAGVPVAIGTGRDEGKVAVRIGAVTPHAPLPGQSGAFKVRGVATNLAAGAFSGGVFTATADGALAAQDGLTYVAHSAAVPSLIFLPEGTLTTLVVSAANSGPYEVTSIGGTTSKVILTRPAWYRHGGQIPAGQVIDTFGTGTLYGGSQWKTFCAAGLVIGTGDPVFWPNRVVQAVTLASGTLSAALTTIPVRSATKSTIEIWSNPATAPHANTRVWRVSALTPGAIGTASIQVVAESAPGTTNSSDVGQYNIAANNW